MSLPDLGNARYVSIATWRRDGREVRTPVWVARDGERLVVWTNVNSGKVKRIRRSGRVCVAPCDARGGLKGDWQEGIARILDDPAERDAALEHVFAKYGWQMRLAAFGARLGGRWGERAALEIVATQPD